MEMEENDIQESPEMSHAENDVQESPETFNQQSNAQEKSQVLAPKNDAQKKPTESNLVEFTQEDLGRFSNEGKLTLIDEDDIEESQLGVFTFLDDYGPLTIITEKALAKILGCHPITPKRMIEREELPQSTRFNGKPCWMVGILKQHIQQYFLYQNAEAIRDKKRFEKLVA